MSKSILEKSVSRDKISFQGKIKQVNRYLLAQFWGSQYLTIKKTPLLKYSTILLISSTFVAHDATNNVPVGANNYFFKKLMVLSIPPQIFRSIGWFLVSKTFGTQKKDRGPAIQITGFKCYHHRSVISHRKSESSCIFGCFSLRELTKLELQLEKYSNSLKASFQIKSL